MLNGIRVVELSTEPGAALAGRLLAAYGADVIVVEPPAGHPLRSLAPRAGEKPDESILFAYLGAGKRSVTADLADAGDRDFVRKLIATADLLLESTAPGTLAACGLDPARLIDEQPSLVVCSATPYGQDGPKADWRSTPLTGFASGGEMALCGDPDKPPLKVAGNQAPYQLGLNAFSSSVAALFAAKASGTGDWIDLSMQEVQTCMLEGAGPGALFTGSEAGRTSGNRPFAQWGIHPCADGYIGVAAMPRQSYAVYDCIGHPEMKEDPAFASGWTPDANALLSVYIPEWTADKTAAEIFAIAATFRAPFAVIPGPKELLEWPGLVETGFWREVEHPVLGRHPLPSPPIQVGEGERGIAAPAPLLGEHTATLRDEVGAATPARTAAGTGPAALPFDGLRVIDVTAVWAGPFGTRYLADYGAEVIKVEGPSFSDPVRTMAGARGVPEINQSYYFNEYNRNKLGISLDLKQPKGMEALRRLIANADVFIENWSSGVADRLGLGYRDLKALNPRIIYVSMPGFGHSGPDADRIGFGPTIEQMGGLVALQGYEGDSPHRSGISYGDPIAGTIAAGAVSMGLLNRERTGEGCYLAIPQRDAICSLIGEFVIAEALGHPMPVRMGAKDAEWAPHNVYQARDTEPREARAAAGRVLQAFTDAWVAIAVDSEDAWEGLKRVIGNERLNSPLWNTAAGRKVAEDDINAIIAEWVRPREANAAAAELQAAGVPASPVMSPLTVTTDAHLEARTAFLPYSHPDTGPGRTTRPTWRMARRPATTVNPAPRFGEHSRGVLQRVAGYTPEEVDAMEAASIITHDLIPTAAG